MMEYSRDPDDDDEMQQRREVETEIDGLLAAAATFTESTEWLYNGGPYGPNTSFHSNPSDAEVGHEIAGTIIEQYEDDIEEPEGLGPIYDQFGQGDGDQERQIGVFASALYNHEPGTYTWDIETGGEACYIGYELDEQASLIIEEDVLGAGSLSNGLLINEADAAGLGYGHTGVLINNGTVGELAHSAGGITINRGTVTDDGQRYAGRLGSSHRGILINYGETDRLADNARGITINYQDGIDLPTNADLIINCADDVSVSETRHGGGTLIDLANSQDHLGWDTRWDQDRLETHPVLISYLEDLTEALGPDQDTATVVGILEDAGPAPERRIRNELSMLTGGEIDAV